MKISCPNCSRVREIDDSSEFGQHIECCCSHRFVLSEDCVVEDDTETSAEPESPGPPEPPVADSLPPAPPSPSAQTLLDIKVIGGYVVSEKIGEGAMGTVYKGMHPKLNIPVAVKVLRDRFAKVTAFADRFIRAARICAKMDHPGIVRIYDCGRDGDSVYLVMEYVDGGSVLELLSDWHRLEPGTVIEIGKSVCGALIEGEKIGVVHRDIKPENIMRTSEGEFKLADLGLAKQVTTKDPDGTKTVGLASIGTPHYMSPEQAIDPSGCDQRADIYSLGVTFYELLTGQLPFLSDDTHELARMHREEVPEAPSNLNPKIPPAFDMLLWKCIEKDKEKRYQSARELLEDLERLEQGENVGTYDGGKPIPKSKPDRILSSDPERLSPAVMAAVIIVILVVSVGISLKPDLLGLKSRKPATPPEGGDQEIKIQDGKPRKLSDEEQSKVAAAEKQEALWNFAVRFANDAKVGVGRDLDIAIENFEAIRDGVPGTSYATRAADEIEELKKIKQEAISSLMRRLASEAAEMAGQQRYLVAAAVYSDYKGPFAKETQVQRESLAKEFRDKGEQALSKQSGTATSKEPEAAQDDGAAARSEDLVAKAGKLIFAGEYAKAAKLIRNDPGGDAYLAAATDLDDAVNAHEALLKGIRAKRNSLEYVKLKGEKVFLTFRKVENGKVYAEEEIGNARIVREFDPRDLSLADRSKFLGSMSKVAQAVYLSVEYARIDNLPKARSYAKLTGRLRPIMKSYLDGVEAEKLEVTVQATLKALFERCSMSTVEPVLGPNVREHLNKRFTIKDLNSLLASVLSLTAKYEKTRTVTKNRQLLTDLEALIGQVIEQKIQEEKAKKEAAAAKKNVVIEQNPQVPLRIESSEDMERIIYQFNPAYNGKGRIQYQRIAGWVLDLRDAEITNISFLRKQKISQLLLNGNPITDIGALEGCKIDELWIFDTGVHDISALKNSSLKKLMFTPADIVDQKDMAMLRKMSTLRYLGADDSAAEQRQKPYEFWKRYDKGDYKAK